MDVAELIKVAWPYAIVAAPGVWAVWKQWNGGKSLVTIAQEAAAQVIKSLQDRVQALEDELTELRKEHADTMSAKDAELALLRGQLRQALATVHAYERKLTAAGIPHEKPMQPFYHVPSGDYPTEVEPL